MPTRRDSVAADLRLASAAEAGLRQILLNLAVTHAPEL
jgi:hypothetical protein